MDTVEGLRDAAWQTPECIYDLGACWEHEITLETTVPRDHSQDYPVCAEFRGDPPVEYWCEEEPEEPQPFGLNEVNRRLAALGREPA